jgi:hypothetical protein
VWPAALGRTRYSWLPGTGLNLMPRSAMPTGLVVLESTTIAVQTMFVTLPLSQSSLEIQ